MGSVDWVFHPSKKKKTLGTCVLPAPPQQQDAAGRGKLDQRARSPGKLHGRTAGGRQRNLFV